eukprot:GHRR01023230.1.p1 GENE.GHRR01023230.1~~GHRR01023230.1.p1  ORF type:complete len:123 (+),score=28.68 GHRR01023230.1:790-1158(+)
MPDTAFPASMSYIRFVKRDAVLCSKVLLSIISSNAHSEHQLSLYMQEHLLDTADCQRALAAVDSRHSPSQNAPATVQAVTGLIPGVQQHSLCAADRQRAFGCYLFCNGHNSLKQLVPAVIAS